MQGVQRVRNPDEARRGAGAGAPAARVPAPLAALLATLAVLLLPLLEPLPLLRALPAPGSLASRVLAAGSCRPAAPTGSEFGPTGARMVAPCPPRL